MLQLILKHLTKISYNFDKNVTNLTKNKSCLPGSKNPQRRVPKGIQCLDQITF